MAHTKTDGPRTQLLASGVAVPWAIEAQRILAEDWGVSADVWSVTRGTNCAVTASTPRKKRS